MIKRIFHFESRTINSAALILFLSALGSRVLGLLRDGLLAGYFGGGRELDIYFAAFRIPDFLYNIFIGGGVALVFLPLFARHYAQDKEKAWEISNLILNIFLTFLFFCAVLSFLLAPYLSKLVAPGFNQPERSLLISLMRILLLSPIFFGAASLFGSIVQYFNRFLVYAIAPLIYNLSIILSIIFFSKRFGVIGVSWGVIIGAFLYFLLQFVTAKMCGFRWKGIFNFRSQIIKKTILLIIPRMIASAAQQINLIVVTAIASTLSEGSIAVFSFANNLQYIPIGLIGTPFALAAFPTFSKLVSSNNYYDFKEKLRNTISKILFFVVPLSVILFILRAQIVRLVLGTLGAQRFDWVATRLTAASLGAFCFGIFAVSLIPLLARAFFSLQDTKTPAIVSVVTVIINISLAFLFIYFIQNIAVAREMFVKIFDLEGIENIAVVGLPMAFSLAAIFQAFSLIFLLVKKIGDFGLQKIIASIERITFASFLLGLNTYFFLKVFEFFNNRTVFGLLLQTVLAAIIGMSIYLFLAWFMRFPELRDFLRYKNERNN